MLTASHQKPARRRLGSARQRLGYPAEEDHLLHIGPLIVDGSMGLAVTGTQQRDLRGGRSQAKPGRVLPSTWPTHYGRGLSARERQEADAS